MIFRTNRSFVFVIRGAVCLVAATLSLAAAGVAHAAQPVPSPDVMEDVRGKEITAFVLYRAALAIGTVPVGGVLELTTESTQSIRLDTASWCRMAGHELLAVEEGGDGLRQWIRRGEAPGGHPKMAMVISDPGLGELLSPLGTALAAQTAGIEVHIFFQGPGVRVLREGFKEKLNGAARPFSPVARRQLASAGHLPPQEKLAQLHELGARLYICGGSMDAFGVSEENLVFDDIQQIQYFSFVELARDADIQIYLQ